jgi:hypothetical protein
MANVEERGEKRNERYFMVFFLVFGGSESCK